MALGGFTKIPLLQVVGVGEGGEPTKLLVLDADGKGVGYLDMTDIGSDKLPLSGGTMTGDIISGSNNIIFNDLDSNPFIKFGYNTDTDETGIWFDNGVDAQTRLAFSNKLIQLYTGETFYAFHENALLITNSIDPAFKGILGNRVFDKLNDRLAFAQLGDIQNATGTESHTDTAYSSGAPFTVLAGVTAALPNNSGIIYNEQTPDDIASFYTGGKITGRNGDGLSIMIYFKCTPSSINSELDIWIDIGGAVGELYRETKYFRGTTVKSVLYTLPAGYTRATWETNGGTIYVKPSVNMTFYGMSYNFLRTHKAKPVV